MILLLKASLVVIFLLAFYKLLLEKESFFSANRLYLIGCLFFACLLPFIVLPKIIDNQGIVDDLLGVDISTIAIEKQPNVVEDLVNNDMTFSDNTPETKDLDQKQFKVSDESKENQIIDVPLKELSTNEEATSLVSKGIGYWFFWIYIFGVIVLTINLLGQLFNVLLKVMNNKDQIEDEGVVIVNMTKEVEPCSFFNYIFINPSSYDFETYEQIVAHEKIHVSKRHSIDLLLSEIAIVILWFNPFVWLLRKEVEKNIEYQTDDTLLYNENDSKEAYQLNLVKIACNTSPLAITTNYNQSLIKQRIIRMNTKKSNQFNYWKYAFSMPIVFILLLILNRPFEAISNTSGIDLAPIMVDNSNSSYADSSIDTSALVETANNELVSNQPLKQDENKAEIRSFNKPVALDSKLIANCEAFEKAVVEGNLELVKELLKTLDPDCLKVKGKQGSNLNTVNKMVKVKKKELRVKSGLNEGSADEVCTRLRMARDLSNEMEVRDILLNEDISCIQDVFGEPARDLDILKRLLKYGARLDIDSKGIINISNVGFYINTYNSENYGCEDRNYKKLVKAINDKDVAKIRSILSGELLTCPLNENGVTNDFIFIKENMKFDPEINIHNSHAITVKSVDFAMDIDKYIEKPEGYNISYEDDPNGYYEQASIIEDIQQRIHDITMNPRSATCLDLINAVKFEKYELVKSLLKTLNSECYHRETNTEIKDGETLSVSKVTTPLTAAIQQNNLTLTQLFVENGADLNYAGDGSETPLIVAARLGNEDIVKLLVENGADMNRRDKAGYTPLYYSKYKNFDGIYEYLKSKGAM